jgi:hypothetical protein
LRLGAFSARCSTAAVFGRAASEGRHADEEEKPKKPGVPTTLLMNHPLSSDVAESARKHKPPTLQVYIN